MGYAMGAGDRIYWTDGSGSRYAELTEQIHKTKHKWGTSCTEGKSVSDTDCLGNDSKETMSDHEVRERRSNLLSMNQLFTLFGQR